MVAATSQQNVGFSRQSFMHISNVKEKEESPRRAPTATERQFEYKKREDVNKLWRPAAPLSFAPSDMECDITGRVRLWCVSQFELLLHCNTFSGCLRRETRRKENKCNATV